MLKEGIKMNEYEIYDWSDWPIYFPKYHSLTQDKKELMEAVKQVYRDVGYSEEKDFPNEYYFMFNPITMECVRIYYHGRVVEYHK
jgi:hypothetical protein